MIAWNSNVRLFLLFQFPRPTNFLMEWRKKNYDFYMQRRFLHNFTVNYNFTEYHDTHKQSYSRQKSYETTQKSNDQNIYEHNLGYCLFKLPYNHHGTECNWLLVQKKMYSFLHFRVQRWVCKAYIPCVLCIRAYGRRNCIGTENSLCCFFASFVWYLLKNKKTIKFCLTKVVRRCKSDSLFEIEILMINSSLLFMRIFLVFFYAFIDCCAQIAIHFSNASAIADVNTEKYT